MLPTWTFQSLFFLLSLAQWANCRHAGSEVFSTEPLAHLSKRLPTDLAPIWYNLTLQTYVPGYIDFPGEKNQTFTAHLSIRLFVLQSTNKIELQAKGLTIPTEGTEIHVDTTDDASNSSSSAIKVISVQHVSGTDKVVFELDTNLTEGSDIYLKFHYNGHILDDEEGFYYSSYIAKSDGKERWLASTHMEPNGARLLVPCFDEPSYKAIWRVTVIHPKGTTAISNAIELGSSPKDENWIETKFEETPPMSSYLLALVVSDYSYRETYLRSYNGQNIRFRVWANENGLHRTELALLAGVKALGFYEKHFGISFPIPKMDMISVPRFSAGAMENWGLVTFRESALLYSSENHLYEKHWVAEVIAHELTHQWFGDLVTLSWWDDLFLNEGFATLFSAIGAVQSVPEYDVEGAHLSNIQTAMSYDSHAEAPPLSPHSGFDGIAYSKGSAILRMIEQVMGPENFIHGIRRYLHRHQYGNTKHIDLLTALQGSIPPTESNVLANISNSPPLNLVEFGTSWIERPGHPLVSVTRLDPNRVKLTQKRFYKDGRVPETASSWPVPIWYTVNHGPEKLAWLNESLVLENVLPTDLLLINERSHGYYRVKYRGELMQQIQQKLLVSHSELSPLARARIIDDAFSLADADRLNYDSALNLVFYDEEHPVPKELAYRHLVSILDKYQEDSKAADHIRQLSKGFLDTTDRPRLFQDPSYHRKSDISYDEWKLERRLSEEYGRALQRDSPSKEVVLAEFRHHVTEPCEKNSQAESSKCNTLPDKDHLSLYCEAIKYSSANGSSEFDLLSQLHERERDPDERSALLQSLTCTENKEKIRHLLDIATDAKNPLLKLNERELLVSKLSISNVAGKAILYDYVKDNWGHIYEGFKGKKHFLKEIVRSAISNYPANAPLTKLDEFIEKNVDKSEPIRATFDEGLESLKANRRWVKKNSKPVAQWFAAKVQALASKSN